MKNKNLIIVIIFFLFALIALAISLIIGNKTFQSFAIGTSCTSIGLLIGTLIREKIKIINEKKFKTDLIIYLPSALIGSFIMAALIQNNDYKIISVLSFNILMLLVFIFRNITNIEPQKDSDV
nr:hypothetical protein [uncultured Carboxylicivirga sp.]